MALELVVVTPEGEAFAGTVDQVVLPGVEGEFGVLESHERFLSALEHGCMEIRTGEGSRFSAVSDGFAEVTGERVVVMVDGVVDAEHIDLAEVNEAFLSGLSVGCLVAASVAFSGAIFASRFLPALAAD